MMKNLYIYKLLAEKLNKNWLLYIYQKNRELFVNHRTHLVTLFLFFLASISTTWFNIKLYDLEHKGNRVREILNLSYDLRDLSSGGLTGEKFNPLFVESLVLSIQSNMDELGKDINSNKQEELMRLENNSFKSYQELYEQYIIVAKNQEIISYISKYQVTLKKISSLIDTYKYNLINTDKKTRYYTLLSDHVRLLEEVQRSIVYRTLLVEKYFDYDLNLSIIEDTAKITALFNSIKKLIKLPEFRLIEESAIGGISQNYLSVADPSLTGFYSYLTDELGKYSDNLKDINRVNSIAVVFSEKIQIFSYTIQYLSQYFNYQIEELESYAVFLWLLWALALLFLLLSLLIYKEKLNSEAKVTEEKNSQLTNAVIQTLDNISGYINGDLDSNLIPSPTLTKQIATAFNSFIFSLKNVAKLIQKDALEVSKVTDMTFDGSLKMKELVDNQTELIISSNKGLFYASGMLEELSLKTSAVYDEAKKTQKINIENVNRLTESIQSIDIIRGDIQSTSRRLKHLAESSQRIGEIVEFLTEISNQTKLVASNASIQIAGDSKSSFGATSLVQETQKLANLVGENAQQANEIAIFIQRNTTKTIEAMELLTAKVVEENKKNQQAKKSLEILQKNYTSLIVDIEDITGNAVYCSNAIKKQNTNVESISILTSSIKRKVDFFATSINQSGNVVSSLLNVLSKTFKA